MGDLRSLSLFLTKSGNFRNNKVGERGNGLRSMLVLARIHQNEEKVKQKRSWRQEFFFCQSVNFQSQRDFRYWEPLLATAGDLLALIPKKPPKIKNVAAPAVGKPFLRKLISPR